jgi:small subunit ribosomal protein S4e
MTSGAHHHLKRVNAPAQWDLEKTEGKYAVRPLPGPHNKEVSIPLKYIIAKFLKAANTSKEIEYILSNKMIAINGKEITTGKFPVGLFDVITVKKTNSHFRLYFEAEGKFKLHKIDSAESGFRISKVVSKHSYNQIPLTSTMDGYNFKFADPSININDTVKVDIKTNKIVSSVSLEVGKIGYVYSGPNTGRIGIIQRIDTGAEIKTVLQLQDKNQKVFTAPLSKVMVIGNDEKSFLVSMDSKDGIRLDSFEKSNIKYAAKEVEVEDN